MDNNDEEAADNNEVEEVETPQQHSRNFFRENDCLRLHDGDEKDGCHLRVKQGQ